MSNIIRLAGLGLAMIVGALANAGSASAADMSCAGKHFVFFPGGGEGDAFATIVYNGAKLAAQQTGCDVEYVWSDWNPQKMVQQLSEAIARKPTGIAVMGHPGDEAMDALIDQAEKAGIIVTAQNVSLPKAEGAYKSNGFGYVGAELYQAGWAAGDATIKKCGLKSGDEILVWGLLGQPGRGERTRGAKEAAEKAGLKVDYLEISDAVNKDGSQGIPVFASFVAAHPGLKALVTDHGVLTGTVPALMKGANKAPGAICAGGFDMSAATVQGIKDGYIAVVLDQQPFLQGYLPVLQLYLTAKYGFAGLHIDTGAALITKDNVGPVADLAKDAIR